MKLRTFVTVLIASAAILAPSFAVENPAFRRTITGDLTLDQAVQVGLRQNPNILKAIQQIEQTRGQIIEVRAQALPHVALNGTYFQQAKSLLERRGQGGGGGSSTSDVTGNLNKALSNIPGLTPSAAE